MGYWIVTTGWPLGGPDLAVWVVSLAAGAIYVWGISRQQPATRAQRGRVAAFIGGLIALLLALAPSIAELAAVLFSVHTLQHALLVLLAAPLLALSDPISAFSSALHPVLRGRWVPITRSNTLAEVRRQLGRPLIVSILFVALVVVWHWPVLYEAAAQYSFVHAIEHITLFGTAFAFWRMALQPNAPLEKKLASGAAIPFLLAAGVESGVLGAALTLAVQPWYPLYAASTAKLGISPLDDQQLAGLVIWISGLATYTSAAAVLFVWWLNALERDLRRRQGQIMADFQPPRPIVIASSPPLRNSARAAPAQGTRRAPWAVLPALLLTLSLVLSFGVILHRVAVKNSRG